MILFWFRVQKIFRYRLYKLYFLIKQKYFYFITRKFFRSIIFRYFFRRLVIRFSWKMIKPIFKINFFLNFNFRFKKKIKYIRYKFFRRIKKVLFSFKYYRSLRKSMFYFIFRRKSRIRLKFISSNYAKLWKRVATRKKWSQNKFKHFRPVNLKRNYRRFWSRNRENLNYFMSFRAPKQYRKTKYFAQFKAFTPMKTFNLFNHNIFSMLYFSNFFYSYRQIMHFVKNNFVFKNGRRVSSKYVTFSVGDRLNIIFSKKYYFYSLFINFIFYKNLRRLGYFHWKFIRFRWNFLKHKPKNPNKFYEKYIPYYSINPTFLEFDYKSLTIIYLLTNKHLRNLNEFYLKYINFYFFRLYNWKYII